MYTFVVVPMEMVGIRYREMCARRVDMAETRLPDSTEHTSVDEAWRAAMKMVHLMFRQLSTTTMHCIALRVDVEDGDNVVHRSEVILRGALICPNCGAQEGFRPIGIGKREREFGYDRVTQTVVSMWTEPITGIYCQGCGQSNKASTFTTGLDRMGWPICHMGKDFVGSRYVSLRKWHTEGESYGSYYLGGDVSGHGRDGRLLPCSEDRQPQGSGEDR